MKNDIPKLVAVSILLLLLCACSAFCGKDDSDSKGSTQETVPVQVRDETINFPKIR